MKYQPKRGDSPKAKGVEDNGDGSFSNPTTRRSSCATCGRWYGWDESHGMHELTHEVGKTLRLLEAFEGWAMEDRKGDAGMDRDREGQVVAWMLHIQDQITRQMGLNANREGAN